MTSQHQFYVSALPEGSGLAGIGTRGSYSSPQQASYLGPSRNASFETALGSTPPSAYGSVVPTPMPPTSPGYQAQMRPMAPGTGAHPTSALNGPFHFTAATPVGSPLSSVPEGQVKTQGNAYSSMPAGGSPPTAGVGTSPSGAHDMRAQSMPAGDVQMDRAKFRDRVCTDYFDFVDASRIRKINMSQNKTGLTMVFEKLNNVYGGIKLPKDDFYVKVFRNYDRQGSGFIDLKSFKDIVVQYDEHAIEKMKKKASLAPSTTTALPPPPPIEGGSVAVGSCAVGSRAIPDRVTSQSIAVATSPADGHTAARLEPTAETIERSTADSPVYASAFEREEREEPIQAATSDRSLPVGPSRTSRVGAAEIKTDVYFPTYVGRLAIFDDYEFHGDVGHGAFGKVMVVKSKHTGALRACKVMPCQTAQARELIDTEVHLLKTMNHPNIVKLHEVYFEEGPEKRVSNGNIYLTFELCEGGDLFSRILHHYQKLHQPMTEGHVAYMMKQILSALAYCHKLDIIHRDIKPENILFVDRTSSSAIKIIDYGLANFTEKIRETAKEVKVEKQGWQGKLARMLPVYNGRHLIPYHERRKIMQKAGTPHYMAPEMLDGEYDSKADVFSTGIIFCQLLTGWHPFYIPQVDDEASVKKKIQDRSPVTFPGDIFSNVSAQAQDLCKQLLEKDPAKRLSAQQALEHPWFQDPAKPSPTGNKDALSMSIFEGLMKYQAYNKLKRAVLQLLTRELSEYQIQELRKKFNALDSQGDGLLSPEELIEGMRHVGYEMNEEELAKVMAALDGTGSQQIGYKEFISALIQRRVQFDRSHLLEVFKKFDTDNTGKISYHDVSKVLQGRSGGTPGVTESEWAEIALPGSDRNSTDRVEVTFEQFVEIMEADN